MGEVADSATGERAEDAAKPKVLATDWVGLVSVLLLSAMAIITAWNGFQASKWGGAMSISFTQAGAARLEAASLAAEADRRLVMHAGVFAQWLVADSQGDKETADALASRFNDPWKSAFAAWLATNPDENPNAPETPFEMPEYTSPQIEAAAEAGRRADALFAQGQEYNQRGDNYTLLAVVGAAVLFFAALATRFLDRRFQWAILGAALVLFLSVVAGMITLPKLL